MKTIVVLLTFFVVPSVYAQSSFSFRETSNTSLELSESGKPVFVYNFGMVLAPNAPESMQRSCYLHPVYSPDGAVLTDDFNPDHPHHRGISWMWADVSVGGRKGDMWTLKTFQERFVRWKAREVDGPTARLAVENGWFDGDRKFVNEEVEILTHPAKDGQRQLEFTLKFEAVDRPVVIAGTSEGRKGFGGFCFRFAPRDGGAEKTIIRTDKGIARTDRVLDTHPWAEIAGVFHGKPAGARVADDPSNPGYPNNGWLLRHGFGFLNVSYPGLKPVTLEPGKPLMLKYRVILFSGDSAKPEAKKSVVASGAKLLRLSEKFEFTEGPTCDAQGNVFFTDQPNNRIMEWSVENKLSTFLQPAGRSNGMYFDAKGNLIACADEKNELWSIAPDGKTSLLWKDYKGKRLNGPNDVWIHPGGGLYLTDPFYKRPWWQHDKMPQDGEHVYCLAPGRRKLIRVTDDLTQPNGITGTPDGKTLFVADIGAKKTFRYDIQPDGKLTGKKLFCAQGSDGMTIDNENNLYLTGNGVMVFDPTGKQIEHIQVPDEPWTANVCFGGKDRQTLFMTASKGLYSIRMRVKGANPSK
jgi:gluconolactonase